jgi:hypothetical protein
LRGNSAASAADQHASPLLVAFVGSSTPLPPLPPLALPLLVLALRLDGWPAWARADAAAAGALRRTVRRSGGVRSDASSSLSRSSFAHARNSSSLTAALSHSLPSLAAPCDDDEDDEDDDDDNDDEENALLNAPSSM